MKMMHALALAAALPAMAQSPAEFRFDAPVAVSGADALNRVTLPFEAYREARPDLADLRLFNAQGEALPIAFAGEPAAVREEPKSVALPIFPISAQEARAVGQGALDVTVRSDASGTLVSVHGRPAGRPAPARTAAWLVDASAFKSPLRALTLAWDVHAGTEVVKVNVEASDDLRAWRGVAFQAPLMRLEQGEAKIEQPRVELGSTRAKYLRITGAPEAFMLTGVRAISDEVVTRAPRSTRAAVAQPGTKAGEYLFDLGARLPIEAVRVRLASNSVAPLTLSVRDDEKQPWRTLTAATFYNLTRQGATIESPAVEVARTPARHVRAQLDPRSPALGAAPGLEVQWRPAQVVFVARGAGPYRLAFGNREAARSILSVTELIPGYEAQAEMKLAEARVGDVRANVVEESAWRSMIGDANPRKVTLWAILVIAVLVLAGMAWRLSRQMGDAPRGEK